MTDRDPKLDCRLLLRSGLDDDALELAVAGFGALWRGQPIAPADVLPGREEVVVRAVAALTERGRAELDDDGLLIGVQGLTLRRSRHSFVHDGRTRHTWCAFDSVGIPAALELDAVAHSDCPTCGSALIVEIESGQVPDVPLTLWLPEPDHSSHLMQSFCAAADLYCSRAHLEQHIDVSRTPGSAVSLAEGADVGREVWADVRRSETTSGAAPIR